MEKGQLEDHVAGVRTTSRRIQRERERDALDFSLILRAGDVPRKLLPSVVIRLISAFLSSSHLKRYRTVFLVIIIDVKNMQQPYHNASTVRLPAAGCN